MVPPGLTSGNEWIGSPAIHGAWTAPLIAPLHGEGHGRAISLTSGNERRTFAAGETA